MRSYEQSCELLDQIVGRCIREADFAAFVLSDPEAALNPYELTEDEMDDFRALKAEHEQEAGEQWSVVRDGIAALLGTHQ